MSFNVSMHRWLSFLDPNTWENSTSTLAWGYAQTFWKLWTKGRRDVVFGERNSKKVYIEGLMYSKGWRDSGEVLRKVSYGNTQL